MATLPLMKVALIWNIVAGFWLLCALVLILVILIQKGKGGGLSGAFGGGMASGILGSKTGDFLTWVTIVLVGVFLLLAVVLAKKYRPASRELGQPAAVQQRQPLQPQPTAPAELPKETELPGLPEQTEQLPQGELPGVDTGTGEEGS